MEMRKLGGLLIWLILVGLSSGNKIEGENEKLYGNRTSRSKKEKVNLIHVGVVVDEVSPSIGGAAQKCIKMGILDFYALHPNYHNKLVVHIRDSQDVVAATSAGQFKLNFLSFLFYTTYFKVVLLVLPLIHPIPPTPTYYKNVYFLSFSLNIFFKQKTKSFYYYRLNNLFQLFLHVTG